MGIPGSGGKRPRSTCGWRLLVEQSSDPNLFSVVTHCFPWSRLWLRKPVIVCVRLLFLEVRMDNRLIVTWHAGALAFIHAECPSWKEVPVKEQVTADDVRGKCVLGNLPLHLAALCSSVLAVEFDGAPPRGTEYGVAEMRAAGARITEYFVRAMSQE